MMYVGIFDIVQYDCPVVWLTERVKDSNLLVVGANVAEIRRGYEKIYVVVLGDESTINRVLESIDSVDKVKKYEILRKKRGYAKVSMLINKTRTMEAAVDYDATPMTVWVALDGFERWTLGFHTSKHVKEFMRKVSERDYIERYEVVELPEHALALNYACILSLVSRGLDRLTRKQVELLSTAMRLGYYEWPRRVNADQLAREFKISRVAVAKTLRRAERNVISTFLKILEDAPAIGGKSQEQRRTPLDDQG